MLPRTPQNRTRIDDFAIQPRARKSHRTFVFGTDGNVEAAQLEMTAIHLDLNFMRSCTPAYEQSLLGGGDAAIPSAVRCREIGA